MNEHESKKQQSDPSAAELESEEVAEGAAPAEPEAGDETATAEEEGPSPEERIAELEDRLLRAFAETENLRRRAQREREDAGKYAIAGFARDMLVVADNLRRALAAVPEAPDDAGEAVETLREGVAMTERELLAALERHGIRAIAPEIGEKFTPERHEAMFEVPTDQAPPGAVVQVFETGYSIHDRLLRPARVGVAKAPPAEPERVDTTV